MLWALAVLFFQTPAVPQTRTVQARDAAGPTRLVAEPESKPIEPSTVSEAPAGPSLQQAGSVISFRTRRDLAMLFGSAEQKPVEVQPGRVASAGESGAATDASGSNRASLGTASTPPLPAGKGSPFLAAGRRRTPKLWYALVAAGHGAATFDAWTTRRVIQSGLGHELNPLLRPFANSNALYGAMQAGPGMLDFLARRMMHSPRRWVRRLWWLPQVAGTAGSFWSGAHNLRVANR